LNWTQSSRALLHAGVVRIAVHHAIVRKYPSSVQSLSHIWFGLSGARPGLSGDGTSHLWSFSNSMFRFRFVDHGVPATCRSLAAARLRANCPSGNVKQLFVDHADIANWRNRGDTRSEGWYWTDASKSEKL
jgi:hypothetical protein